MIQITAYLRDDEDLKKWKAIENKAAWLHDQLLNPVRLGSVIEVPKTSGPANKIGYPETNPIPVSNNPLLENARDKINNDQIDKVIKTPKDVEAVTGWQGSNFKKSKTK